MRQPQGKSLRARRRAGPWREVLVALGISLLGTLLLGGPLLVLLDNVWWLALAGVASLAAGGLHLGWRTAEAEPLHGAVLAIAYFAFVVAVLFSGTLADWLPDPLPGLVIGDSTFFFVWPLLQLAAAVVGTVASGRLSGRPRRR